MASLMIHGISEELRKELKVKCAGLGITMKDYVLGLLEAGVTHADGLAYPVEYDNKMVTSKDMRIK